MSRARRLARFFDNSSTVIEAAPTQDIPAAAETAASPTAVSPTAAPSVSAYEAVEEPALLPANPERRVNRLPWALAGVAALLLAAITFALVSNFGSGKAAEADKAAKLATKDENSTAAPNIPAVEQTAVAPDNSEIITTTDASGVNTETRTFKNHPRISKVVLTTANGQTTARVFFINGDERELPAVAIARALEATGDELEVAANFIETKEKSPAPGAKVASRKAVPPVKAPPQKTLPDLKVDHQNDPAQKQTDVPAPTGKQMMQSRAAGPENVTPINQTADGVKKKGSKN